MYMHFYSDKELHIAKLIYDLYTYLSKRFNLFINIYH